MRVRLRPRPCRAAATRLRDPLRGCPRALVGLPASLTSLPYSRLKFRFRSFKTIQRSIKLELCQTLFVRISPVIFVALSHSFSYILRFRFLLASDARPRIRVLLQNSFLPRKEVIQPHLPIRLPCYDFTPVINPTFDNVPLAVRLLASGVTDSHGVTGGVYKARERIHRGMLIRDY